MEPEPSYDYETQMPVHTVGLNPGARDQPINIRIVNTASAGKTSHKRIFIPQ